MADEAMTPEQRYEFGVSLRDKEPLDSHVEWGPPEQDRDPVQLIEEQNDGRLEWLVPVRRARMSRSSFAFYRGSARIMATDLANSPVSGLQTQICGDAHLANFGAYASPERRLVFDLNDFDETLPGPWEWDVKRLAASFMIACRYNGLNHKNSRAITRQVVRGYGHAMHQLANMRPLDIWYSLVEADKLVESASSKKARKAGYKAINKAKGKNHKHVLDKLAEEQGGKLRIRSRPPLIVPLRDIPDPASREALRHTIMESYEEYLTRVPDEVEHHLKQYRVLDFAVKVVGVGSVGTRCFIMLMQGRDETDPFFMQIKQANASVLEEFLGASHYPSSGQRVVEGQKLMQTVSDLFLGWTANTSSGRHYYWRQLKDWKASADVENSDEAHLRGITGYRAWTLARAHARSGDPIAIAGYLGKDKTFERAITAFAERYAKQNDRDYSAFTADIDSGKLDAAEL